MGILDGVRVLDFGRYITAPFCCQLLADMGADVIRVDRPGGEADRQRGPIAANGQSLYFVALNRNKKDITLNLNAEKGRDLLRVLVKETDVLVHNLPAPRARALGLDYEMLREVNNRLVYLAVSGFGSDGPYSRYTAFDPGIQALSGATAMTGLPGNPPTLSHIPYMDFTTGLYGALAVSLALLHRERTGNGQSIDLAMFSAALSMVGSYGVLAEHAINGVARSDVGNDLIYGVGGCYPARDGNIIMSVLADGLWRRLCKTIDRQDLLNDPRLSDDMARYDHREEVNEAITQWTMQYTADEAAGILAEAGIPVGRVQEVGQVADHPQVKALDMIRMIEQPGLGSVPVSGVAMKFSDTPGEIKCAAPDVGQDNHEVYSRFLGPDELQQLTLDGVI